MNKNNTVSSQSFSTSFVVDESPKQVFDAVTNVRGWWSEEVKGGTSKLNDEFDYRYQDVHSCKMRLIEVVPEKKIVWLVLDNHFNFTKDQNEWKGDKIIFEIAKKGDKTELRFVHEGLVPEYECFDACYDGWSNYIKKSLRNLITTGKGQPNPKES